jgi:hypothetical protein
MPKYVEISQLCHDLDLDRSNLRRYAIKNGFSFARVRTEGSRKQLTLALTEDDAEALKQLRDAQGFMQTKNPKPIENGDGFFYVLQVIPELDATRVKLGFTCNMTGRLQSHRTTSPTAVFIAHWPCKKPWEIAAMASITRIECRTIGFEVFVCEDTQSLVSRGHAFFSLMPE